MIICCHGKKKERSAVRKMKRIELPFIDTRGTY